MTEKELEKFKRACREVIQAAKDYPKNIGLQYASSYASQGLRIVEPNEEAIRTQAIYILSNLAYWRGILATDVKRDLKVLGGLHV